MTKKTNDDLKEWEDTNKAYHLGAVETVKGAALFTKAHDTYWKHIRTPVDLSWGMENHISNAADLALVSLLNAYAQYAVGKRCKSYDQGCFVCDTWKMVDDATAVILRNHAKEEAKIIEGETQ